MTIQIRQIWMKQRLLRPLLSGSLLLLVVAGLLLSRDFFSTKPWQSSIELSYPSFVHQAEDRSTLLIDQGLKRLLWIDSNGQLSKKVSGGKHGQGQFFFADEVVSAADGGFYLLNRIMDPSGFLTVRTELQHYSEHGTYLATLASRDYSEAERAPYLVQRAPWFGLRRQGTTLTWFEIHPDGLRRWQVRPGQPAASREWLSFDQADLLIAYADSSPNGSIFYITRQGDIYEADGRNSPLLWYRASTSDTASLPWRIRVQADGSLVVSDLGLKTLVRLDAPLAAPKNLLPAQRRQALGMESDATFFSSLSVSEHGNIGTVNDSGAFVIGSDGIDQKITNPTLPPAYRLMAWAWWLAALSGCGLLILFLRHLYVDVMARRVSPFLRRITAVVILTLTIGSLVTYMILDDLGDRYTGEFMNKITQMVHLVPRLIDADAMMAIDTPDKFLNADYQKIRAQIIDALYGKNFERNAGLYFAIHRINPADQKLYTFMWLNGEPTIWHPYRYLWDPSLAFQASVSGQTVATSALDPFGSWLLGTAPIRAADGSIIGVFEIGGDFYSYTQENNRLIRALVLNIGTALVMLLMLMVEWSYFSANRSPQLPSCTASGAEAETLAVASQSLMTRPLSVLLYAALSVALLLAPSIMSTLLASPAAANSLAKSLNFSPEMLLGLPLSLRLFFFGSGTLLAGSLTYRFGWKPVFSAGLGLALVATCCSALTNSVDWFLIASCFLGLGTGLSTIGLRSVINQDPDPQQRFSSYSHFYAGLIAGTNIGVMAGQWLTDVIGYRGAFWSSAALIVLTAIAAWRLLPGGFKPMAGPRSSSEQTATVWSLLLNRRALLFFITILLPIYFASMFLGFYLPVFALDHHLSNADTGRIFLMNGLVITYVGPLIFQQMRKKVSALAGVVLSALVWSVALLPFIKSPDLYGLIASILLLGVAEGMAAPYQNEYFLNLPVVHRLGADKAAAVMEVVGKIGETIAPVLIGLALTLGPVSAFSLVAATLFVLATVFTVSNIRRVA